MGRIKKILCFTLLLNLLSQTLCYAQPIVQEKNNFEKKIEMTVGDTYTFNNAADGTNWKSSKINVVSVLNGEVTALSYGSSKVSTTIGNKKYTCSVLVSNPVFKVKKDTVSKVYVNIQKKVSVKLKNVKSKVTYKSSDPSIFTISKSGSVKGIKEGKATIIAECNEKEYLLPVIVENPKFWITGYKFGIGEKRQIRWSGTEQTPVFSAKSKSITCTKNGLVETIKTGSGQVKTKINNQTYKISFKVSKELEPHVHNYVIISSEEPTISQNGYKVYECTGCGDTYTEEVPFVPADWVFSKHIKEATCSENGADEYIESVTGRKETRTVSALGHVYSDELSVDKEATYTEEGEMSLHCLRCGHRIAITKIPKKTIIHNWGEGKLIEEPTCTEDGIVEFTCSITNDKKQYTVSALGHNWESKYTIDVVPSEFEDGSESIHCTRCTEIKDSRSIPGLNNWEYHVSENKVYLDAYIGESSDVVIAEQYSVSGNVCDTYLTEEYDELNSLNKITTFQNENSKKIETVDFLSDIKTHDNCLNYIFSDLSNLKEVKNLPQNKKGYNHSFVNCVSLNKVNDNNLSFSNSCDFKGSFYNSGINEMEIVISSTNDINADGCFSTCSNLCSLSCNIATPEYMNLSYFGYNTQKLRNLSLDLKAKKIDAQNSFYSEELYGHTKEYYEYVGMSDNLVADIKIDCKKLDCYSMFTNRTLLKTPRIDIINSFSESTVDILNDSSMFGYCLNLLDIKGNFLEACLTYGSSMFSNCYSFNKDIVFPDMCVIGSSCFNQSNIHSISFNGVCSKLNPSAFKDCPNLVSAKMFDNTIHGDEIYNQCNNFLPKYCFEACNKLDTIEWGSVNEIKSNALHFTGFKELKLPKNCVLDDCINGILPLQKLIVPKTMKSFNSKTLVFGNYYWKVDPVTFTGKALYSNDEEFKELVNKSQDGVWGYILEFEEGFTTLEDKFIDESTREDALKQGYLASQRTELTNTQKYGAYKIIIPESMMPNINSNFSNSFVREIEYPENTRIISTNKVYNSESYPNYYNGSGSFMWSDITSFTFKKNIEELSPRMFDNCVYLNSVTFEGNKITKLPCGVFGWCKKLDNVELPDSIKEIGHSAFRCCENLKNIRLPENIEIIGQQAFDECSVLTEITIPKTVTEIGDGAFWTGSTSLVITFKGTTEQWNSLIGEDPTRCLTPTTVVYCTGDVVTSLDGKNP